MSELEEVNIYLKQGFSLLEALMWVVKPQKRVMIETIKECLITGDHLALSLKDFLKPQVYSYLYGFSQVVSFEEAFELAIDMALIKHRDKQERFKLLVYPLFMIAISVVGLIFFSTVGFSKLALFMEGMLDLALFYRLKTWIDITLLIILTTCFMMGLVYGYLRQKKRQVLCFILMNRYGIMRHYRVRLTYRFMLYYRYCTQKGLNTKDTLDLISHLKEPLLVFLSYHVKRLLLEGASFEEAMHQHYLDQNLIKFVKMAKYAKELDQFFAAYLSHSKQCIDKVNRLLVKSIQVISYALIGLLLVMVYQVLLMPLDMIKRF